MPAKRPPGFADALAASTCFIAASARSRVFHLRERLGESTEVRHHVAGGTTTLATSGLEHQPKVAAVHGIGPKGGT
ncbi:MAG TPA: hypothetical protein VIM30_01705 [Candidatus Limnocylindrales bacterium]|jgi:hypothetical protein